MKRKPCHCYRYPPQQVFTGGDLNLYYDARHTQWYKRPDWFLVVGVSRLYDEIDLRSSYVVWQESVNPFVVVHLLASELEQRQAIAMLKVCVSSDRATVPRELQLLEQRL